MKAKTLILLWAIAILAVDCAKKAPPVSYERIVPKRIVDLQGTPRNVGVLLDWKTPKENTDKTPLTNLVSFQIFRSEGTLVGNECKGCGEKPKMIYEMKVAPEDFAPGKKVSIFIEDQQPRRVYVYQVVSINRRGHPSALSNPVTIYWDHPPRAPTVVKAERGDKRVDLSWESVESATGFNIYRRIEGEKEFPLNPLNREPVKEDHYTDLGVHNDIQYFYSVRAVKRVAKTDVEGKGSPALAVTPMKLTAPSAPVELVAIPLKEGIELNWRMNPEPDVFGYNVYRRKIDEKEFKKLNDSPVERETYLDTQAELGQDYDYAVTAVDNSPRRNESPRSEEVRVKYLLN